MVFIQRLLGNGDTMQYDGMKDNKIFDQLDQVKLIIDQKLRLGDSYLNESLNHVKATTGKMIRPLLLLIGSSYSKRQHREQARFIDIAAVIETLHMATLIHDDIIDEAKIRRGQESIQSKYSKSYAVYMGDFLLSQSFLMIADLDIDKKLEVRLAKAIHKICVGEMKQDKWRYNVDITPREYLKIVSGKTAALFSIALSAGALHGKAKESTVKLLTKIGYQIGMAFQVIDDLLDYTGNDATVGKELRADLIQGHYSLPVIFALRSEYGEAIQKQLEKGISDNKEVDYLIENIKKSGAIDITKSLAVRYNNRAMTLVEQLPRGEGKKALKLLIPQLLNRVN